MRKNYFKKLIKCMKNVYHIENGINKLRDGRVNPKYKTSQAILSVLLGFLLRIQSLNELKFLLKENEFRNIFPKRTNQPGIDTIRDTLKVIELNGLKFIIQNTVKKAIENKVFVNGTIDGYTVAAVDGSRIFWKQQEILHGMPEEK